MELKHGAHEHKLILKEEHNKSDGAEIFCYGCEEPILRGPSYYSCSDGCEFFLHKLCAQLPEKVEHSLHPGHDLIIRYQNTGFEHYRCSVCTGIVQRFFYICLRTSCHFYVDAVCALTRYKLPELTKEIYHEHPLIPLQKQASFLCDACGREHKDASFLCATCGFWVSQECASLPTSIQNSRHHHGLTLVYLHPSRYSHYWPNCKICHEEVNLLYWVYCCAKGANCKYFAHSYCITSLKTKELPSGDCEAEDEFEYPEPNPISLPLPDEYVDLTASFIRELSRQQQQQQQGTNKKKGKEINHESHRHPLTFFDNIQINDESSSAGSSKLPSSVNEEIIAKKSDHKIIICNGCIKPVWARQAPYYGCCECNYFLHEWCAKLPSILDSPCHPEHQLYRFRSIITKVDGLYCNGCRTNCNGFVFCCFSCHVFFDLKCASMPQVITHKAHTHDLHLQLRQSLPLPVPDQCAACISVFTGLAFVCDNCNFILDIRCALLPGTVRHRYDEHPFALTYTPIEGTDEYYCEICEEEINPAGGKAGWFYHCVDCDQSLHTQCICPISDKYSNIKFGTKSLYGYGLDKKVKRYTLVRLPNAESPCDHCGIPFDDDDGVAVESENSDFRLHLDCAREMYMVGVNLPLLWQLSMAKY